MSDLVYNYSPEPTEPLLKEGVTTGWLVWSANGKPGPARVMRVLALVDGEGVVSIESTGDWEDTTIVDDRDSPSA